MSENHAYMCSIIATQYHEAVCMFRDDSPMIHSCLSLSGTKPVTLPYPTLIQKQATVMCVSMWKQIAKTFQ